MRCNRMVVAEGFAGDLSSCLTLPVIMRNNLGRNACEIRLGLSGLRREQPNEKTTTDSAKGLTLAKTIVVPHNCKVKVLKC